MASDTEESEEVRKAVETCDMTQCMIDFTAKHLDGLRTLCATTEEITQRDIRESESKIIKLFSKQLVARAKLSLDKVPEKLQQYPRTEQWLKIVGINADAKNGIIMRGLTLDGLLEMTEQELGGLMNRYGAREDETTRLCTALKNLKAWTALQLSSEMVQKTDMELMELHWSSYKSASNSPYGGNSPKLPLRPSVSSLPPEALLYAEQSGGIHSTPSSPVPHPSPGEQRKQYTPPPTPSLVNKVKGKFPTTPPPHKRNILRPEPLYPLTKSRSHESQLANRIIDVDDLSKFMKKKPNMQQAGSYDHIYKRRKSADSAEERASRTQTGQTSPKVGTSPKRSPPYKHTDQNSLPDLYDIHQKKRFNVTDNQLSVPPMSPRPTLGSRSMMHAISHRFQAKPVFGSCDHCRKYVIIGKVCKDCKYKFHKDCATKAAPACGLPTEYIDFYIETMREGSPSVMRHPTDGSMSLPDYGDGTGIRPANSVPAFQAPDSSSNTSSCNSSTPSSPALIIPHGLHPISPSQPSPQIQITPDTQFQFPDVTSLTSSVGTIGTASSISTVGTISSVENLGSPRVVIKPSSCVYDVVNTNTSNDSDKSDKTLVDSNQSGGSTVFERTDSQDAEDGLSQSWHRQNSISQTLKEWDIPYEELCVGDLIGGGRFGTVYKGNWHGDVAIKMLKMDSNQDQCDAEKDNQAQLFAFKQEVATLKKTRHENLVLFMGACMKPPHLAIVTSLCKGETLYKHIHLRGEKFQFNKMVIVGSQIAQGMGYLHAKGIIHKDLKTKNVFLERGGVVITDFGLCNVTKMCHGLRQREGLSIPKGWLCYLAPEITRRLQPWGNYMRDMDLPFSEATDCYAFGTVWYELLTGEWPFRATQPEVIIWQVGRGIKQSLSSIHSSKDVKDLLMSCWAFKPSTRPDFGRLLKTLEKLPKKRLARSPSHPVQISRSAESVF